jgi:hypothetical protein
LYANANPAYDTDPSGKFSFSLSESVAISVLTGILAELLFPDPLQTPTQSGDYAGPNPWRGPFEMVAGVLTGAALTRLTNTVLSRAGTATVQVFRVEGAANTRVLISEAGEVALEGSHTLFLNFGQRTRAIEFFNKRLSQGLDDVKIKEFEVPKSFLDDLRTNAVPERLARSNPNSPIRVDVTKAPDQYGLRREQIEQLRQTIIQGSGKQTP